MQDLRWTSWNRSVRRCPSLCGENGEGHDFVPLRSLEVKPLPSKQVSRWRNPARRPLEDARLTYWLVYRTPSPRKGVRFSYRAQIRGSFNGRTSGSKPEDVGSIPAPREPVLSSLRNAVATGLTTRSVHNPTTPSCGIPLLRERNKASRVGTRQTVET